MTIHSIFRIIMKTKYLPFDVLWIVNCELWDATLSPPTNTNTMRESEKEEEKFSFRFIWIDSKFRIHLASTTIYAWHNGTA